VTYSSSGLRIVFANGISLLLPLEQGKLRGVTEVAYRGWPLRNAQAPPVSPVIRTEPLHSHTACRYASHEQSRTGP